MFCLKSRAAARVEGAVGRPEVAGAGQRRQGAGLEVAPELQAGLHRFGQDQDVGRHAGARVRGAGDAGVEGAHRRLERVAAAGDGQVGVVGVHRGVGADDGELVGQLRQLREGAAEGDAGQRRLAPRR